MSETNDQRIYDRCIIRVGQLEAENERLRELVRLLLHGIDHDAEPADGLAWSHEVEVLMRELGVEVDSWVYRLHGRSGTR